MLATQQHGLQLLSLSGLRVGQRCLNSEYEIVALGLLEATLEPRVVITARDLSQATWVCSWASYTRQATGQKLRQPQWRAKDIAAPLTKLILSGIVAKQRYRHYRGTSYEICTTGLDDAALEPMIVYGDASTTWIRPLANFVELVDGQPRFLQTST
jgi:hypothetical protein